METQTIGVVIGRFESPYIHEAHKDLLEKAARESDVLCIVLGTHGGAPTNQYPLDINTREVMLRALFPEAVILPIRDVLSNKVWSDTLDEMLRNKFGEKKITLYGSRDSFIPYYSGKYQVVYVREIKAISATSIRELECAKPIDSTDFRKGAIYAATSRFPIVYPTVDIVPYRKSGQGILVLLGKKKGDGGLFRFIGGFVDTTDRSHADAALRELDEEVGGIEVGKPTFVTSCKIDDPRYFLSRDSVLTTLFIAPFKGGIATASDDLDGVYWVNFHSIGENLIPHHYVLLHELIEYFTNKKQKL